jgi:hypothetical protein
MKMGDENENSESSQADEGKQKKSELAAEKIEQ